MPELVKVKTGNGTVLLPAVAERAGSWTITLEKVEEMIAMIRRDRIIGGALEELVYATTVVPGEEEPVDVTPPDQVCVGVGHCAVGAILFGHGVSNDALAIMPSDPGEWNEDMDLWFYNATGLRGADGTEILCLNDGPFNEAAKLLNVARRAKYADDRALRAVGPENLGETVRAELAPRAIANVETFLRGLVGQNRVAPEPEGEPRDTRYDY